MKEGDFVHYMPDYGSPENGRVKSVSSKGDYARVVYKCAGEWHRYQDYTGAMTEIRDLRPGWLDKKGNPVPEDQLPSDN
jgi:hypothetical protein